jgi:hypothetical protein
METEGDILLLGLLIAGALVVVALPVALAVLRRSLPTAVRIYLLGVAVSPAVALVLLQRAMHIGDWVGGSHVPLPSAVHAVFVPAYVCAIGGIAAVLYALWRRDPAIAAAGMLGVLAALLEYMIAGLMLVLIHIT